MSLRSTVQTADALDERWTVFRAGHPIPDQRGIDATRALIDVVEQLNPEDTVVALISGGGSALFEAPRDPLTLADFAELTQLLLQCRRADPASQYGPYSTQCRSKAAPSGGDRRRDVSSRSSFPMCWEMTRASLRADRRSSQHTSGAAALAVLDLYGLRDDVSPAVRAVLNDIASEAPDWNYPEDIVEVVGDVALAIEFANRVAREDGWESEISDSLLEGEASEMARAWVETVRHTPKDTQVLWSGGENTVTVRGDGAGGRNTEFALAAALELDRLQDDEWVIASLATDGQDGISDSAGAIASRRTIETARALGIDPHAYLANNDSASFFEQRRRPGDHRAVWYQCQ